MAAYTPFEQLEGDSVDGAAVVEFPFMELAKAWYDSPAYRAIMHDRQQGEWTTLDSSVARLMDKAKRRHPRARRNHLQLRRVILTCYFCFGSRHSKKMERVGGGWFVGQKPTRFSLNAPSGRSNRLNLKQIWRRRVGVEPTIHPAKGRIAGFEGREDHRTPCASVCAQSDDSTSLNLQSRLVRLLRSIAWCQ